MSMSSPASVSTSITTFSILFARMTSKRQRSTLATPSIPIAVPPFSPIPPTTYRNLVKGLVDNNKLESTMELKEEMDVQRFAVDPTVYHHSMVGCVTNSDVDGVFNLYEDAIAYNSVLDALSKNGKFDEALRLFDRMIQEHKPPRRLAVFRKMGNYRCSPDTLSFNVLIEQLCNNGLLTVVVELYGEMGEKEVNPDEFTLVLLMDTCFEENRVDDAAMRPNLADWNKYVENLVKVGKVDEAKSFFDLMVKKFKMDMSWANVVDTMLDDDGVEFSVELQEFVRAKKGMERSLWKRNKAAEAARVAVNSLIPSKLFGNKDSDKGSVEAKGNAIKVSLVTG
ncbi:hypothetical protein UlMin_027019 [Ulmus minor]